MIGRSLIGAPSEHFATAALVVALGLAPAALPAQTGQVDPPLEQLSLEDLMRLEVVTVTGFAGEQFVSPAAVYVLSGDEIRRSGMRSLPEALRLVPGMFVGRQSSSSWVTGARGFTGIGITASRYLVMIDGRVVFDPLISVALWDVVDVAVDDIDRIEVILGPGATLWGVNAMNGVIQVITKSAAATRGGRVSAGGGSHERYFGEARWGGSGPGDSSYRVWGKGFAFDSLERADGADAHDEWSSLRGGVRFDGATRGTDWTVEASAYSLPTLSTSTREPVPGEHLQFRQVTTNDDVSGGFARVAAGGGTSSEGWSAKAYFDTAERLTTRIGYRRDIVDLDFRTWQEWGAHQQLIWGLSANHVVDEIRPGSNFIFDPESDDWYQANAFVQNTSELVPDRLFAMLGSKFTYHEFVGFEAQPGARLWWTPDDRRIVWASISRPVRVPSRLEESGMIVVAYADPGILAGGEPTGAIPFGIRGDDTLEVEELLAWELGFRQRGDSWGYSASLFYNDYDRLVGLPPGAIGRFSDEASGRTWGGELWASLRVRPDWRLEAGWSELRVEVDGPVSELEEDSTPRRMAQLRSYFDLTPSVELTAAAYYVEEIPQQAIDDYTRVDLGVRFHPGADWTLEAWGQNLFDEEHREASPIEIPSSFYLAVELRF